MKKILCVVKELWFVPVIFILVFIFNTFIGKFSFVLGESMQPTLESGDILFVREKDEYKQGDIVVFKHNNKYLIKRVVAVEGQTIDINFDKGVIYVDGQLYEDGFGKITERENFSGPVTISENCLFVLGDNHNNSIDSREFGEVPVEIIEGSACYSVFPPAKIQSN